MNSKSLALFALSSLGGSSIFSSRTQKKEKEKMPMTEAEIEQYKAIVDKKDKKRFIKELKAKRNF